MILPGAVNRYARPFAAVHRVGHSVSSPLGAWMVLAVAAQAAPEGELRDEFEDLLGFDDAAAASALDDLLRDPPSVASAALAAWGFTEADWSSHPYAVVAVARGGDRSDHPWNGVPVFAGWVAEPCEPSTSLPKQRTNGPPASSSPRGTA